MSLTMFRTAHGKVDRFRGDRARQTDEQFLADCGARPGTDLARIALGVRRCVADAGLVDSAFVRATDAFPGTLSVLPLWDSMDFLDLVLRIDRELGIGWDSRVGCVKRTVFARPRGVGALHAPYR